MKNYIDIDNGISYLARNSDIDFNEQNDTESIRSPKIMMCPKLTKIDDNENSYYKNNNGFNLIADIETSAIITITENGFITFANRSSEKIFGYLISEMVGKHITMLVPKYIHNLFIDALNKFVVTGRKGVFFQTLEFTGLHKRGKEIPLALSIGQQTINGKHLITYLFRDRTDIKTSEDNQIKLQNQIYQLQRLKTIGSLTNGIAHDFNNILTPILGFTELAMHDLSKSSITYSNLKHVRKAVYRAKELINQISTFNRQHNALELKPILIAPIVKEVIKLVRSTIPATIEIKSEIDKDCGYITANSIQIYQVLMNLFTNAFHAMKESGGVLEVTLKLVHAQDKIALRNKPSNMNIVNLKVKDTGHGIDRSIIKKIFDPFFTTKSSNEGTGIGLSLVHDIVLSSKGDIHVESIPDIGTTFDINFPQTNCKFITKSKDVQKSCLKGNEKILYLDTDAEISLMSKYILESYGYHVQTFANSIQALKLFYLNPDEFDIVIINELLPGLTGIELAKELICLKPNIPIIFTIESSDTEILDDLRMLGINNITRKPLIPNELVGSIRNALDKCYMTSHK